MSVIIKLKIIFSPDVFFYFMDTGKVQRIDHKVPKGEASFEVMPGIKMFPRLAFELFFDFMPTVLIPALQSLYWPFLIMIMTMTTMAVCHLFH